MEVAKAQWENAVAAVLIGVLAGAVAVGSILGQGISSGWIAGRSETKTITETRTVTSWSITTVGDSRPRQLSTSMVLKNEWDKAAVTYDSWPSIYVQGQYAFAEFMISLDNVTLEFSDAILHFEHATGYISSSNLPGGCQIIIRFNGEMWLRTLHGQQSMATIEIIKSYP